MSSSQSLITHGTGSGSSSSLTDLSGLFLSQITISGSRDETNNTDGNESVVFSSQSNPTLEIAYEGEVAGAGGGVIDNHPGVAYVPDANLTEGFFGFNPTDGVFIYKDPVRTISRGEATTHNFSVTQYPLVA